MDHTACAPAQHSQPLPSAGRESKPRLPDTSQRLGGQGGLSEESSLRLLCCFLYTCETDLKLQMPTNRSICGRE